MPSLPHKAPWCQALWGWNRGEIPPQRLPVLPFFFLRRAHQKVVVFSLEALLGALQEGDRETFVFSPFFLLLGLVQSQPRMIHNMGCTRVIIFVHICAVVLAALATTLRRCPNMAGSATAARGAASATCAQRRHANQQLQRLRSQLSRRRPRNPLLAPGSPVEAPRASQRRLGRPLLLGIASTPRGLGAAYAPSSARGNPGGTCSSAVPVGCLSTKRAACRGRLLVATEATPVTSVGTQGASRGLLSLAVPRRVETASSALWDLASAAAPRFRLPPATFPHTNSA